MSLNYLRFEVCEQGLLFDASSQNSSRVFAIGNILIVRGGDVSLSRSMPSDLHGVWMVTRQGNKNPRIAVYAWDKRKGQLLLRNEIVIKYPGVVMIGPRVKKYIKAAQFQKPASASPRQSPKRKRRQPDIRPEQRLEVHSCAFG